MAGVRLNVIVTSCNLIKQPGVSLFMMSYFFFNMEDIDRLLVSGVCRKHRTIITFVNHIEEIKADQSIEHRELMLEFLKFYWCKISPLYTFFTL